MKRFRDLDESMPQFSYVLAFLANWPFGTLPASAGIGFWLLPWFAALFLTRRYRWCGDGWLDFALRVQWASVCVVMTGQVAGAIGLLHWVFPWVPPLMYVLVVRTFATFTPPMDEPAKWSRGKIPVLPIIAASTLALTFGRYFTQSLIGAAKVVSDGPIYHLYFAARWWVAGRIEWIPIPFGENAAPYFPANGDVWFTYLVGWTGDLTLAQVGQVPFWFFAGYLIVCLCRTLGASAGAGVIAASIWMTLTPLVLFTFEANVDTIFAAWFLAGVYFYVVYDLSRENGRTGRSLFRTIAHRSVSTSGVVSKHAGANHDPEKPSATETASVGPVLLLTSLLASGLAWGTKAPGLVFVPPWLLLVTILELARMSNLTVVNLARKVTVLWALAAVPVGFWWIRNILATGNPLYPLPLEIGGVTLADGWYGPEVMRLSPYYIPFGQWRAGVDQLLAVTDPRIVPLLLPAIVWWGPRSIRWKSPSERWVSLIAAFGIATICLFWGVIPYRTQQRFFLHGLALFAPLTALCMDRFRGYRILCVGALLLHVFTTQGWPYAKAGVEPPWDFSPMIPNAVPGVVPLGDLLARLAMGELKTVGVIVMTNGLIAAWIARSTQARIFRMIGRTVAIIGFGLTLAGEQALFDKTGRGQRFPVFPDYERAWSAFEAITKSGPKRVAYTGTNLAVYLMGPKLANHVEYVNVNDRADAMTHDYHLDQPAEKRRWDDPRPTWERLEVRYDAWRKNLLERGIDLVVVARANPNEGRANPFDPRGFPIERTWMDTHPDHFRPVYGVREGDPEMRIYEVVR